MKNFLKIFLLLLVLLLIGDNLLSSNDVIQAERSKTNIANDMKLSQLAPYLGKRIILYGLVVYGSFGNETKEFPYFLLYGDKKLHISLDVDVAFFRKLPQNTSQQAVIISGILNYFLIDLTLPQNEKLKMDLENGDICWPVPSQYGAFELKNVELIQIIIGTYDKINIKEIPLTSEDNKIKDSRFSADGNMNKFKNYIQHLIKNNN